MSEGKKRFVRNLICNKMHTIVYILQWGDMINVLNIGFRDHIRWEISISNKHNQMICGGNKLTPAIHIDHYIYMLNMLWL